MGYALAIAGVDWKATLRAAIVPPVVLIWMGDAGGVTQVGIARILQTDYD